MRRRSLQDGGIGKLNLVGHGGSRYLVCENQRICWLEPERRKGDLRTRGRQNSIHRKKHIQNENSQKQDCVKSPKLSMICLSILHQRDIF